MYMYGYRQYQPHALSINKLLFTADVSSDIGYKSKYHVSCIILCMIGISLPQQTL